MLNRFNRITTRNQQKSMRNFVHLLLTFDKIIMKKKRGKKTKTSHKKWESLYIYLFIYLFIHIYQVSFERFEWRTDWICGKSFTDRQISQTPMKNPFN